MDVDSVVCGDSQCKIDTVRIYWDELGFYNRYKLPPGIELEKAAGKPFSKTDFEKLHQILADRNSPLRDVDHNKIVEYQKTGDAVDGTTGATVLLHRESVVKGAAWTCYTLWHWTNGDIHSTIRQITANECDINDLQTYLLSSDTRCKAFAIKWIIKRKAYDTETIDVIINQLPTLNDELAGRMLKHLEGATADLYYKLMSKLLPSASTNRKILYLTSIKNTEHQPTTQNAEWLVQMLGSANDYQEVDLLFDIFSNWTNMSDEISQQAMLLLKSERFLIARRAYWHLNKQELSAAQKEQLEQFRKKHHASL